MSSDNPLLGTPYAQLWEYAKEKGIEAAIRQTNWAAIPETIRNVLVQRELGDYTQLNTAT